MIDIDKIDFEELIRRLSFSDIDGVKYIKSGHLHKMFWDKYDVDDHMDVKTTSNINKLIENTITELGYVIIHPNHEEMMEELKYMSENGRPSKKHDKP